MIVLRLDNVYFVNRHLIITCLDHLTEYQLVYKGSLKKFKDERGFVSYISAILNVQDIYLSHNPDSQFIKQFEL